MFKKDYERTPQEKAQRAKLSVIARLGACAYLIYILVQMLKTPPAEIPKSPWTSVVAIVLIVLAAVVIIITVLELIRSIKAGLFNAATYEEDTGFSPPADTADSTSETDALEAYDADDGEASDSEDSGDSEDDDSEDTKSE